MRTPVCKMLGIELPIFAFSHCRDVVVEVSKAGGMGVLGISGYEPERVIEELRWIEDHIGGKPYGVDILIPNTYQDVSQNKLDLAKILPKEQTEFVHQLCEQAGFPTLPADEMAAQMQQYMSHVNMTPQDAERLLDAALQFKGIKLVVNALGTPPKEKVAELHARGLKVGSLIGKVEHAHAQIDAGVDILVAQGTEAGGHTGLISSMVLWPQVVDAVGDVPVLAAGGVGRGKQMAAALAMGASGVWCGSIWLGTKQSELDPLMKERFFEAKSEDAIQSRALTGKPCRVLKSNYTEAWAQSGAPKYLPMPLQSFVGTEARLRIEKAKAKPWMSYPVGQLVGDMKYENTVRDVVQGMLTEFLESVERLNALLED
ncbi:MAG: nitronate monooxygenase [Spongiibacteraceae bacterium]